MLGCTASKPCWTWGFVILAGVQCYWKCLVSLESRLITQGPVILGNTKCLFFLEVFDSHNTQSWKCLTLLYNFGFLFVMVISIIFVVIQKYTFLSQSPTKDHTVPLRSMPQK